jgi:hypothetical protein
MLLAAHTEQVPSRDIQDITLSTFDMVRQRKQMKKSKVRKLGLHKKVYIKGSKASAPRRAAPRATPGMTRRRKVCLTVR